MNLFKNMSFWKKFSRLLLVGFSVFTLLFAAQSSVLNQVEVLAQSAPPSATVSGPSSASVNENVTYNANISGADSLSATRLWVAKSDGSRVGSADIAGFNSGNFNCDNSDSPSCRWYGISSTVANSYSGSFTPLTAGTYAIIVDAIPGGSSGNQYACSGNPFVSYPVISGGYTWYSCGGQSATYLTVSGGSTPPPPPSGGQAHIVDGDFLQAFNNTTQEGTWRDPVSASPGNIIEYRMTVINDGNAPTGDIQVWGSVNGLVSQDPGLQHPLTAKIHNPNTGQSVTDTATVTVLGGVPVGMRYFPGHARIHGVTNIYDCSTPCSLPDSVMTGINIGVIQPGQMVEVAYKAELTPVPAAATPAPATPAPATPAPATPAPATPTPTPAPATPAPQGNTNVNANVNTATAIAAASSSSTSNNTNNITNSQTTNVTNVNNVPGNVGVGRSASAQVLGVTQLPKTGLPLIAWSALAFVPAGFRLRRFSKVEKELENHPSFIHESRQFKIQA